MKRYFPLASSGIVLLVFIFNNCLYSQEIHRASIINFLQAAKYEKLHPVKKRTEFEKAENNMQKLPGNLPLPAGAIVKQFNFSILNKPAAIRDKLLPMKVSPVPSDNFLGVTDDGTSIPPDGGGAVGPNHIFAAENQAFVIRDKAGTLISSVSPVTFFKGLVPGFSADPHVKYDQYSGRWIVVGQSEVDTSSSVVVAVSQTDDPTGNYNRYVFKIDPTGAQVADFPMVGYNKKWIVITTNLFSLDLNSNTGTSLFVLDKATLYSGDLINFSLNAFRQLNGTPDGPNPCPAITFSQGATGNEMYLLQTWNSTLGLLRLTKISGDLPNLTWPANATFPKFSTGWDFDGGDLGLQKDDSRQINTGDARVQTLVERNGLLWACQTIFINGRADIQWMQLSPGGNLIQTNKILTGSSSVSRAFPSLAVTSNESVLIGYTRFSSFTYASAAYSYRNAVTPFNVLDSEYIYKPGVAPYYKTFSGARNRWGDYSSSAVDPISEDLWTIQEIADKRTGSSDNNSRFATWWAKVTPDSVNINLDAALTSVLSPVLGSAFCDSTINPRVILRNSGLDTLKTVTINMLLDGSAIGTPYNFSGNIPSFENADITLNAFKVSQGNHVLKIFITNPNGITDQRKINDTISVAFTVIPFAALPLSTGFEDEAFPPAGGWSVFNPDGDITWTRTTEAFSTGEASMRINGFDYPSPGETDILRSPKINIKGLDSIYINFDVAYAKFNDEKVDTLEVVYSTDCGNTWQPTGYKKWGDSLTTNGGEPESLQAFIPTTGQWRNDMIKLATCGINNNAVLFGVKYINGYGQDCYIDNITIEGIAMRGNNVQLISINKPSQTLCINTFTPEIIISNQGYDTLKSLAINYKIDDGQLATFNFTGSLARCSTQVITLNPVTSIPGSHILSIYTTSPNDSADEYTMNDTLHLPIIISPVKDVPVSEGFENSAFPPANWGILNPDGLVTWERTTDAARSGIASMVIRNFNYPVENSVDKFISPIINYTANIDSIFATFDYAYAPGNHFPGSSLFSKDTLEIQLTQDCGKTFTSVWKKWGNQLQTINDSNYTSPNPFVPDAGSWKNIKLYLTPFVAGKNFQLYFVAKSNNQNNLYLDNINIYSITLPSRLKSQGYLLYPNPFSNSIIIHHYQPPVNLQTVNIYNSVGQLVFQKYYTREANTQIILNLNHFSPGVYIVKLGYTDKTIVERIVKN